MKVCDVVLNSVWYDPRVRKQIISYLDYGVELCVVGAIDNRYDADKMSQIPCEVTLIDIPSSFKGKQKGILRKLKREKIRERNLYRAILEQKPDIIHANDLDTLMPAYKAAKKLKCKLVYDSHEVCVENINNKNKLWKFVLTIKEKRLLKKVDLMVCVSNAAAYYFVEKYKIKKPLVVTNCTLKSDKVYNTKVVKNETFEILNHGQFYEGRGYDIMADACELIQDLQNVRLALRGFGKMENKLKNRISKLPNKEQFVFYPPVHVSELIKSAASSMVGVAITEPICLNFKLSVSNKLFEYAAAGLPVIMSNIPEHKYLNDKYQFGVIIEKNTPESLVEAIKKLYLDKDFYDVCVKNAKKMTEEVNWENEFSKLLQKEREMLNE